MRAIQLIGSIILIGLSQGCLSMQGQPVQSLNFNAGSEGRCALRLVYKPSAATASNYLGTIAFGTADWMEYHVDGHLAARHQFHQAMNTKVVLEPGEHSLRVQHVRAGVLTLGSRSVMKTKQYRFTLYDGDVGKYSVESVQGDYTPNVGVVGFTNVRRWSELDL